MRKIVTLIILNTATICYSQQQNDTIIISRSELQELINQEVKKELSIQLNEENEKQNSRFMEKLSLLNGRIKFGGNALLRMGEWDFDQENIDAVTGKATKKNTRFWSRFNFYLNMDISLLTNLNLHTRIRTGNKQYSFVTFGGNTDERFSIMLDEFWLNWNLSDYEFRIGRQGAGRIWSNQQGVQFDIPTHDGISAIANYQLGSITLTPKLALFIEKYKDNASYKEQGKIFGGSIAARQVKDNISWKIETGIIQANQLPTLYLNDLVQNKDEIKYLDGDLAPDYSIWSNTFSLSFPEIRNLSFTVDYYHNFKNYKTNPVSMSITDIQGNNSYNNPNEFDSKSAPDFTKSNQGFIGTISVGNTSSPKNLFFGISYLYLEKYAAMDYFAQYDFARWASTNLKGPELTLAYRLNNYIELKSKLFITEEIKGLKGINPDYKRSGNRFRLDMNIKF